MDINAWNKNIIMFTLIVGTKLHDQKRASKMYERIKLCMWDVFVMNPALEENNYLTPSSNSVVFAVCRPDGSWWARCLTAVPEPGWPSARLTSARSGTSARVPATWPTACDRCQVTDWLTDGQVGTPSQPITVQSTRHKAHKLTLFDSVCTQ